MNDVNVELNSSEQFLAQVKEKENSSPLALLSALEQKYQGMAESNPKYAAVVAGLAKIHSRYSQTVDKAGAAGIGVLFLEMATGGLFFAANSHTPGTVGAEIAFGLVGAGGSIIPGTLSAIAVKEFFTKRAEGKVKNTLDNTAQFGAIVSNTAKK